MNGPETFARPFALGPRLYKQTRLHAPAIGCPAPGHQPGLGIHSRSMIVNER